MTEENKFVITESELAEALRLFRLYNICPTTVNALEAIVRERSFDIVQKEHDDQVRAEERERVLDQIMSITNGYKSYEHISGRVISPDSPTVSVSKLELDIQSLRKGAS